MFFDQKNDRKKKKKKKKEKRKKEREDFRKENIMASDDERLLRLAGDPNQLLSMSDSELKRLVVIKGIHNNPFGMDRKQLIALLLSAKVQVPAPISGGANKKRALLIGINYRGTRSELGGCITDTRYMHYCLTKRFGFADNDILMLNEEQRNPYQIPTRANIYRAMTWLLNGVQSGDSLVFMYSGHGSQVRDYSGEEIDGKCETILPLDHERQGEISDKELYQYLIRPLGPGTKLFALCDSCHSGTILDLPYTCVPGSEQSSTRGSPWHPAQRVFKGTSGND